MQYFCSNCENVLKEEDFDMTISASVESCPFCGTILRNTIQKLSFKPQVKPPSIVFKKASSLPKLTLDIPKIDEIFHFLTLNNKLCISGVHTQKLIERICVRAQLPSRHGGLNSKVLLIDGANSSDLYQCVDFAQQYGLNINKILDSIISSRAFTVYQLTNTIIEELLYAIKKYNVKIAIITNLLYYFTDDPHLDTNEMKTMLKEIIKTLDNMQDCLVVVSLGFSSQYDHLFSRLFSRTINIRQSNGILSVAVNDNGENHSLTLKQSQLEIIPQH